MYLLNKSIHNINGDDIKRLIENGVTESPTLEFKRELKIEKGDDKKEFLFDITALANSEGGTIIYGIEELKDGNNGYATQLSGIPIDNLDKLIQKIEDIILNSIEPRLNLSFAPLTVDDVKILMIGVPKTFGLPHMVTYNSTNKFYKRKFTGKILMDVYELNNAFMNSSTVKERANEFRANRINDVRNLKFIPKLDIVGSYFLHVIPLGYIGENILDLTNDSQLNFIKSNLKPIKSNGYDFLYNFEGFLIYSRNNENDIPFSYNQIFRNGSIEFYTSHLHYPRENNSKQLDLAGQHFEVITINSIEEAFKVYDFLKINPPYAVFISLFDLDNALIVAHMHDRIHSQPMNKSQLLFPAVIFNDTTNDIVKVMKPTFDMLWQTGNEKKSPFYTDDGRRIIQSR